MKLLKAWRRRREICELRRRVLDMLERHRTHGVPLLLVRDHRPAVGSPPARVTILVHRPTDPTSANPIQLGPRGY